MLIWGTVLKSPGDKNKIRNDFMYSIYKGHDKGPFTNYVDKILASFDHLPFSVDIFYGINSRYSVYKAKQYTYLVIPSINTHWGFL